MTHDCKYESIITEMRTDIKDLLAEFRAMNGSLKDTKHRFDKHSEESDNYRQKTTTIWTTLIVFKYIVMLLLGGGLLTQGILKFLR